MKHNALERKEKCLTLQLAEMCEAQKNNVVDGKTTKDKIYAKKDAENQVVFLREWSREVKTFYEQILPARSSETNSVKVQVVSAQKWTEGRDYEMYLAKAGSQRLQTG